MLGRSQIESAIDIGDIRFDGTVRRSHLLLRLGSCLRTFKSEPEVVDPYDQKSVQNCYDEKIEDWASYDLYPRKVVLCSASETVAFGDKYGGFISGLSHVARLGLFVHCGSDTVDPGFEGQLTFELFNAGAHVLRLRQNMPVAKVVVVHWQQAPASFSSHHRIRYGTPKHLGSKYANEFK